MAGHGPEKQRQGCNERRDEHADPDGAAHQELLHIWLADGECAERSCFGLAEEDKDRVKFILM